MTSLDSLTKESIGRLLWRYSLPSIVGMLVMSLYNVIDRIILGQVVGADALSGLTITFPVMNLATAIGNMGRGVSLSCLLYTSDAADD